MRRSCTESTRHGQPRSRALAAARLLAAALAILSVAPALALDYDSALARSEAAIGRDVADYALTDSGGRRVRMTDFRGKPLAVSFVYTGCGQICPTTTKFLDQAVRQAARDLGDDAFNVATIGFNLPFDNPAAMDHFAKQQGIARANWKFLSPDSGSVERLTGDFGFAYAANAGGFDHVAQVTIVDPFEAETDLNHQVGRLDGDGWSANVVDDGQGFLLFGPYTTVIPGGLQKATFRLQVDNVIANNDRVVRIEAVDASNGRILCAKRSICESAQSGRAACCNKRRRE